MVEFLVGKITGFISAVNGLRKNERRRAVEHYCILSKIPRQKRKRLISLKQTLKRKRSEFRANLTTEGKIHDDRFSSFRRVRLRISSSLQLISEMRHLKVPLCRTLSAFT